MKTLILYNSKNGATEKCAKYLADNSTDIDLFNINKFNGNLKDYNHILIGTPVYIGRYNKLIKAFISDNVNTLLDVDLSIFVSSMNKNETEEVVIANLSKEIIKHANIYHVGGAYYFEKLNWFYKLVVKKIAKINETKEAFDYDVLNKIKKSISA